MTTNVKERLKIHLLKGGTVTPLQALKWWGTFRLASYVKRLRWQGYVIKTEIIRKGPKTFAKYHL